MFAVKLGREMIDVENTRLDLKETFDPGSPKGMLGLVKDLVAMANSGGGIVAFGRTETDTPGIDEALVEQLDSAQVMDQVNKFVAPATASIGHSATPVSPGRVILELEIAPAEKPPLVLNMDGQYRNKYGRTRVIGHVKIDINGHEKPSLLVRN